MLKNRRGIQFCGPGFPEIIWNRLRLFKNEIFVVVVNIATLHLKKCIPISNQCGNSYNFFQL